MALPRFQNIRSYAPSDCDPILSVHIPPDVAKQYEFMKTLRVQPTLIDKLGVNSSNIDAIGSNAIPIGLGVASIISAIGENSNLGTIIAGGVVGGIRGVADVRSETADQDRFDVCKPKGDAVMFVRAEDFVIASFKEMPQDLSILKELDRSKS